MGWRLTAGAENSLREKTMRTKRPMTRKTFVSRVLLVIIGIFLVVLGIPMLILPGPGIACIAGGLYCIARGLGLVKAHRRSAETRRAPEGLPGSQDQPPQLL